MFSIVTLSGVLIGSGLPPTSPAIRLDEGRVAVKGEKHPKDLAPGESTTVGYPLLVEKGERPRELLCKVTRAALESAPEEEPSKPPPAKEPEPAVVPPAPRRRGGRRPAGGVS